MNDVPQPRPDLSQIETLLDEHKYLDALDSLTKLIEENPSDRQIRIYRLLTVRILLLHQTLSQRVAETVVRPRPLLQEGLVTGKALQKVARCYVTPWVRKAGDAIHTTLVGTSVFRRGVVAIGALGLMVAPITCYVSQSLGVIEQRSGFVTRTGIPSSVPLSISATDTNHSAVTSHEPEAGTSSERFEVFLTSQLPELQGIYTQWIQREGNLTGSLLLKVTVNSSGRVSQIEDLGSCVTDMRFVSVVIEKARNWTFPRSTRDNVEVIIPFLLVPKGSDPATIGRCEQTLRDRKPDESKSPPAMVQAPAAGKSRRAAKAKETLPRVTPIAFKNDSGKSESLKQLGDIYRTRNSLPLREQPRFAAPSLQQLDSDTRVSVLGSNGDWLKVKAQHSSVIGYLRKEFLVAANAAP